MNYQYETPGTVDAVVGVGDEKEIRNSDAAFFANQKRLTNSLMDASQREVDERPHQPLPSNEEIDAMFAQQQKVETKQDAK